MKGPMAGSGPLRVLRGAPWEAMLRGLCCVGIVVLLVLLANSPVLMSRIQTSYAQATGWILGLLGEGVQVVDTTVQSSQFGITVVTACTGLFLTGLFLVAVLAMPTRIRSTMIGVGLGVVVIAILNIIRLVSLYYIGLYLPRLLDVVHLVIWQSLLILAAVTLWFAWAWASNRSRTPQEAR